MTMTNELNLSAIWNLPSQQEDVAVLRHPGSLRAGTYVTTNTARSLQVADGTYVSVPNPVISPNQNRGHYISGTITPSAPAGSYTNH